MSKKSYAERNLKFETLQLHVGQESPDPVTDARAVPIYATSSYVFRNSEHAAARFGLTDAGNIYGRLTNPTEDVFEQRVAALEGGVAALAVASGAAAISYTIQNLAQAGDHIVAAKNIYGGTYNLLAHTLVQYGIETTFVDPFNFDEVEAAIKDNTKAVFIETLGNPNSDVVDIEKLADIAHAHKIPLAIDNTFATPYFQRPLDLGSDIVVHSGTKYLGGHSDVVAGLVTSNHKDLADQIGFYQNAIGAVLGPQDSWLLQRGIKTLSVRMEEHQKNAFVVADFLFSHPAVEKVYYPGLPDHELHGVAKQQMSGFSGMISFTLKNEESAIPFVESLQLFTLAESLGGVESLVEIPSVMTHASIPKEKREEAGIKDGLIRLSVGIEYGQDLINDLAQAFDRIKN